MIVSDFYGQYDYGSVFLFHFYTNGLLDNVVYLVIISIKPYSTHQCLNQIKVSVPDPPGQKAQPVVTPHWYVHPIWKCLSPAQNQQ